MCYTKAVHKNAMQEREFAFLSIEGNGEKVALDFMLRKASGAVAICGIYDRSQTSVRAIAASFQSKHGCSFALTGKTGGPHRRKNYYAYGQNGYSAIVSPIYDDKELFYHALMTSGDVGKDCFFATDETKEELLFSHLMKNFNLPLLKEWSVQLFHELRDSRYLQVGESAYLGAYAGEPCLDILGKSVPVTNIRCYSVLCSEDTLKSMVTTLIKKGIISFGSRRMAPLKNTDTMDNYFKEHGPKIVQNLERQLEPLTGLDGNVSDFTLKHKRLYPQQAVMVHGVKALLLGQGNRKERRKNASSYAILNEGMGTGKTVQGAAICEAVGVAQTMNKKNATLKGVYEMGAEGANYRNIVMCPGHLIEKWAEEIRSEVPFARVEILEDISQLVAIKERGIKRCGREFYVIGKDFAKLSYSEEPTPKKEGRKLLMERRCKNPDCFHHVVRGLKCEKCDGTDYKLKPTSHKVWGMICPKCNNVLVPYKKSLPNDEPRTLRAEDFAGHNTENDMCLYCGERLWQPHVANLTLPGVEKKEPVWRRATHWANKAHKGKKTVWVHRDYEERYFSMVGEEPLNYTNSEGVRRIAPGYYIKKHLKGYFDVALFDEVHTLKGGSTAQGNTMHSLVKASKKQLALTGTIAGGYATHLFYLLFRLDSVRMKKKGFNFSSEMAFAKKYGCVDTEYAAEEHRRGTYLTTTKGRQTKAPKCVPGISPLIFTDFLLDKTVFLDITDMSKYMPKLKETVELVDFEREHMPMVGHYEGIIDALKVASQEGLGMSVLSTMLQFSLSYLDKPYGVLPIKNPFGGEVIAKPKSFDEYASLDKLLPKEQRLVDIINSEQAEGRNCFVFAEYTGSPETCITYRLRDVIMKYCNMKPNEVVVLESASPAAKEREAWIHKKAEEGAKVFITNPKCVETGLDFIFTHNGRMYNYPTLFFYQLGYNLFTLWQASRRHYRLNQTEECRTYYMAYSGTVQEAAIGLIAEKMAATSAIQGKFSAEGLSAMASGVDARLKLAQSLSNMDEQTGADLQGMFDVINDVNTDEDAYSDYVPMKLLYELIESEVVEQTADEMRTNSFFDAFDMIDEFQSQIESVPLFADAPQTEVVLASEEGEEEEFDMFDFLLGSPAEARNTEVAKLITVSSKVAESVSGTRKIKQKRSLPGQVSLLELYCC